MRKYCGIFLMLLAALDLVVCDMKNNNAKRYQFSYATMVPPTGSSGPGVSAIASSKKDVRSVGTGSDSSLIPKVNTLSQGIPQLPLGFYEPFRRQYAIPRDDHGYGGGGGGGYGSGPSAYHYSVQPAGGWGWGDYYEDEGKDKGLMGLFGLKGLAGLASLALLLPLLLLGLLPLLIGLLLLIPIPVITGGRKIESFKSSISDNFQEKLFELSKRIPKQYEDTVRTKSSKQINDKYSKDKENGNYKTNT